MIWVFAALSFALFVCLIILYWADRRKFRNVTRSLESKYEERNFVHSARKELAAEKEKAKQAQAEANCLRNLLRNAGIKEPGKGK